LTQFVVFSCISDLMIMSLQADFLNYFIFSLRQVSRLYSRGLFCRIRKCRFLQNDCRGVQLQVTVMPIAELLGISSSLTLSCRDVGLPCRVSCYPALINQCRQILATRKSTRVSARPCYRQYRHRLSQRSLPRLRAKVSYVSLRVFMLRLCMGVRPGL
jgi:hypothetical protein